MKIIVISSVLSEETFVQFYEELKAFPGQQGQKYVRLLSDGLEKNPSVSEIKYISSAPMNRAISKKVYLKPQNECFGNYQWFYTPIINISGIKNLLTIICSFFYAIKYADAETFVISDSMCISSSLGAVLASYVKPFQSICLVTDLPEYLCKKANSISVKLQNYILKKQHFFILLTKEMHQKLPKKGQNYCVIEGLVDFRFREIPNLLVDKHEKKVCIYAGGLQRIYGIPYLVQAFLKANVPNAELHIYGSGDYQEELTVLCEQHPSLRYFSVRPNAEVVEEELKATLLINPRPTSEEYTKYSFPSKNMEYMVSGTPVLTTKLPGMPAEYNGYVYLIEEETVEGLSNTLTTVLSKSPEELHAFGAAARDFVLREKNNVKQAQKIIEMIKELL